MSTSPWYEYECRGPGAHYVAAHEPLGVCPVATCAAALQPVNKAARDARRSEIEEVL